MKNLSLDQTWFKTLEMWKWIADQRKTWEGSSKSVADLKQEFLCISGNLDPLYNCCYFCEYAYNNCGDRGVCLSCPGRLVDPNFSCFDAKYCYDEDPEAFYRKILELHERRMGEDCIFGESTRVEPKDMVCGRKYGFRRLDDTTVGYFVFKEINRIGEIISWSCGLNNCLFLKDELTDYIFYKLPDGFFIKFDLVETDVEPRSVIMGVNTKKSEEDTEVAQLLLTPPSYPCFVNYSSEFKYHPGIKVEDKDEPRYFEYEGKKYLKKDVDRLFKNLKSR